MRSSVPAVMRIGKLWSGWRGCHVRGGDFHGHLHEFHGCFRRSGPEDEPSGQVEVGQHATDRTCGKRDERMAHAEREQGIAQKDRAAVEQEPEGIGEKEAQPLQDRVLIFGGGQPESPEAVEGPVSCRGHEIGAERGGHQAGEGAQEIDSSPVHENAECSHRTEPEKLAQNLGTGARVENTVAAQGNLQLENIVAKGGFSDGEPEKKKRRPEGRLFQNPEPGGSGIRIGLNYFRMISTRRFCGSRVFGPVGTSGLLSP